MSKKSKKNSTKSEVPNEKKEETKKMKEETKEMKEKRDEEEENWSVPEEAVRPLMADIAVRSLANLAESGPDLLSYLTTRGRLVCAKHMEFISAKCVMQVPPVGYNAVVDARKVCRERLNTMNSLLDAPAPDLINSKKFRNSLAEIRDLVFVDCASGILNTDYDNGETGGAMLERLMEKLKAYPIDNPTEDEKFGMNLISPRYRKLFTWWKDWS